jgi:EF hand domain-containing protein
MQAKKMLVGSGLVLAMLGGAGLIASFPAVAQTSPSGAPATKTDDDAAEFVKLDANKDGFLDKKEAIMEPRLLTNFDAADTNKDGKIDKKEWADFQKNKALVKK